MKPPTEGKGIRGNSLSESIEKIPRGDQDVCDTFLPHKNGG